LPPAISPGLLRRRPPIKEIWPPPLAAGPDDDVFEIYLWRRPGVAVVQLEQWSAQRRSAAATQLQLIKRMLAKGPLF
jgi:hypothetical protein